MKMHAVVDAKRFRIMYWFWTIIFLSLACSNSCQGKHRKKPSAVIVGAVYCDTCFLQNFPKASHFIAGASVAVECKDTTRSGGFRQQVKTNSHGEFQVHLPFSVGKQVNKIKKCSVRLISSNEPNCAVAAAASSSSFGLKSRRRGTHIFSAGFFTFKPLKQPQVCDQTPSINNFNTLLSADKSSPNDLPLPAPPQADSSLLSGFLPPLPKRPRLPPLPGLPVLPPAAPGKEADDEVYQPSDSRVNQPESLPFPPNPFNPNFLPNPFQSPPSVIPPLFPSPPPSLFPPIFLAPPVFHLPPIPGLTPPRPPPPAFPFPLPPFPFQPAPGFPGIPPAEVSSPSKAALLRVCSYSSNHV